MSKKSLRAYLKGLKKAALEAQIMELYERFNVVKVYYNFVFNPKEDALMAEAKYKIRKEYFPEHGRKPKMRRSVAAKFIKHFEMLGVEPHLRADLMCFALEVAVAHSARRLPTQEAFFKSYLVAFNALKKFLEKHGYAQLYHDRMLALVSEIEAKSWPNAHDFSWGGLRIMKT